MLNLSPQRSPIGLQPRRRVCRPGRPAREVGSRTPRCSPVPGGARSTATSSTGPSVLPSWSRRDDIRGMRAWADDRRHTHASWLTSTRRLSAISVP